MPSLYNYDIELCLFTLKNMEKNLLPKLEFQPGHTMATQIYDFLRRNIVVRMLPPGTPLSENELAAHFEVSRNPVHEALGRLSQGSLIEIVPQKGTFVTKISVNSLYEICFLRCAIECQAAEQLSDMGTTMFKRIAKKLETCLKKQEKCCGGRKGMNSKFIELDDDFHKLICDMSGTQIAWNVLQENKANLDRIRYISMDHISSVDHLYEEHSGIYKAIKERDVAKTCELLKKHTYEVTTTYKAIRAENPGWFIDDTESA